MATSLVSTRTSFTHHELTAVPQSRICVKSKGRFIFLQQHSICWLESAGNYVKIKVSGEPSREYIVRGTLQSFEALLDGRYFVRIHRSVIVNCREIREMRPWHTGEYIVTLDCGKELTLSRKYRANLDRLLRMTAA